MKKSMCIIFCLLAAIGVRGQMDILDRFNAIPPTAVPFDGVKQEHSRVAKTFYFPYMEWNFLNINIWSDLNLTIQKSPKQEWDISEIYRRFTAVNGNYYVGLLMIGEADMAKKMLVSSSNTGGYIDALEVETYISDQDGTLFYPKQWRIDSDMRITVYQLQPIGASPIKCYGSIPQVIKAKRIDTSYQIDSTGKFYQIAQIKYNVGDYSSNKFSNPSYSIWQGNEMPE